ncbi:MAG: hypothetical protein LQ344_004691 [Seirophora lacunosa]|nr:MAG: hypothetical protein LQ344_004691 [Seirophora lacunosa]
MSLRQQRSQPPEKAAGLSLSGQFWALRDLSPTVQQLLELQHLIDRECLAHTQHSNGADPALSSGTVVEITLYLSSPLVKCHGADSYVFLEIQLRALIAAFALLLHVGVTDLTPAPHDQLRRNLAHRFNDLVNAPASSREDHMGKATASYLIRLVGQYFSLFKRAQPLSDALPFPVLALVAAGASMAGGQYNGLRSVFQYADEVIGLIPGPKGRYLNLPTIQEITRRATTSIKTSPDVIEPEAISQVTKDVKLVQELLNTHFQSIPSRKSDPWNWPLARLRLGPPMMNKWYFFYGLLDCAVQVSRHVEPENISSDFVRNLKQLMAETEFEEFRWKISEFLPAIEETRRRQNGAQQAGFLAIVRGQSASRKASGSLTPESSFGIETSPATTVASDEIQASSAQDTFPPVERTDLQASASHSQTYS